MKTKLSGLQGNAEEPTNYIVRSLAYSFVSACDSDNPIPICFFYKIVSDRVMSKTANFAYDSLGLFFN